MHGEKENSFQICGWYGCVRKKNIANSRHNILLPLIIFYLEERLQLIDHQIILDIKYSRNH